MDKTGNTFNSAAYGGPGWQGRTRTHREEIGDLWTASGIDSEYATLRSVLLHRPGGELAAAGKDLPMRTVTAYAGPMADVVVQPKPEIGGVRVSFELDPANAELCELRLILKSGDEPVSETWLYRWTRAGAK